MADAVNVSWAVLVGVVSIPTIVTGILMNRIVKSLSDKDEKDAKKRKDDIERDILMMDLVNATGCLAKATAIAVRDGHCNGELSSALDYEQKTRHKFDDYKTKFVAEYSNKN